MPGIAAGFFVSLQNEFLEIYTDELWDWDDIISISLFSDELFLDANCDLLSSAFSTGVCSVINVKAKRDVGLRRVTIPGRAYIGEEKSEPNLVPRIILVWGASESGNCRQRRPEIDRGSVEGTDTSHV
jgi:hypothetical protein